MILICYLASQQERESAALLTCSDPTQDENVVDVAQPLGEATGAAAAAAAATSSIYGGGRGGRGGAAAAAVSGVDKGEEEQEGMVGSLERGACRVMSSEEAAEMMGAHDPQVRACVCVYVYVCLCVCVCVCVRERERERVKRRGLQSLIV